MTHSHRTLIVSLACSLLAAALPALAEEHGHAADEGTPSDVIQVVSTNVQGKNVYIPGTIVVEEAKPAQLSVFNTTDTPHGFSIAGAGIEEVLLPGKETAIEVPALEEGIYMIHCQLHPPHRNAQLVVIDF